MADLTRNAPELRQVAFGRMGMAASVGFVIGPAAAGLLGGTRWGPRLPVEETMKTFLLLFLALCPRAFAVQQGPDSYWDPIDESLRFRGSEIGESLWAFTLQPRSPTECNDWELVGAYPQ